MVVEAVLWISSVCYGPCLLMNKRPSKHSQRAVCRPWRCWTPKKPSQNPWPCGVGGRADRTGSLSELGRSPAEERLHACRLRPAADSSRREFRTLVSPEVPGSSTTNNSANTSITSSPFIPRPTANAADGCAFASILVSRFRFAGATTIFVSSGPRLRRDLH